MISPQNPLDITFHLDFFIFTLLSFSAKHIHPPTLVGSVYRQSETEDCDFTAGAKSQIPDDSFSFHFFLKDNNWLCDFAASFQFRS